MCLTLKDINSIKNDKIQLARDLSLPNVVVKQVKLYSTERIAYGGRICTVTD